jgi:lysophospholipase L1-like esterase
MIMVWTCCLLVGAELAVRVRTRIRFGGRGSPVAGIYEPDALLGRRPRPGTHLDGTTRSLSINRWGFRGGEIPKVKPEGTIRIAALGDSTTFAMEASSDDATWVAEMERLLNKCTQSLRFDTINAGVPGYTLATSAVQLSERVMAFKPDIVLGFQVATDIAGHTRRQHPAQKQQSATQPTVVRFFQEHVLLVNLIRQNMAAFHSKHVQQNRHDRLDEAGLDQYREHLLHAVSICRENGIVLVLCTCPRAFGDPSAATDQHTLAASALANNPTLSLFGLNDAYTRYNEVIREAARQHDLPLVDLDHIVPKRAEYFHDSIHLSDRGHRVVAEATARVVLAAIKGETGGNKTE